MEQSAGWSYTKKDAHLCDRSKDYGAIRGLLWGSPQDVLKAVVVTETDQAALKTVIQNSPPVIAYDVKQSADCYGTIRGLFVYEKGCAHL